MKYKYIKNSKDKEFKMPKVGIESLDKDKLKEDFKRITTKYKKVFENLS